MDLEFKIKRVTSNLGDQVTLHSSGVTCIVGANNVGKSQLLKDIHLHLVDSYGETPVVLDNVELTSKLSDQIGNTRVERANNNTLDIAADPELHAWLKENSGGFGIDHQGTIRFSPSGQGPSHTTARDILLELTQPRLGGNSANYFISNAHLSLSGQFQNQDGMGELDGSFLAQIHRSSETEARVSDIFEQIFGIPLIYDLASGFNGLRLGHVPNGTLTSGRPSEEYTQEIRSLSKLSSQGRGMQNFLESLSSLLLGSAQVVLLDEPEAYLHPPQARALGKIIGLEASKQNKQVLVVTHNKDFVIGLLESDKNTQFIRVAREGSGNRLQTVNTDDVKWIWDQAVLRYSNVLSALFYKQVVICESDSDCRMFGAILDSLVEEKEISNESQETLFVPAGGTAGAAKFARALEQLHVKTKVIFDFDILLGDKDRLEKTVEALGGTWTDTLQANHSTLGSVDIPRATLKNAGVQALPAGKPTLAVTALLNELQTIGIFVIRVGEIEDFRKESARDKEAWVTESLEKGFHRAPGVHRDFALSVLLLD